MAYIYDETFCRFEVELPPDEVFSLKKVFRKSDFVYI